MFAGPVCGPCTAGAPLVVEGWGDDDDDGVDDPGLDGWPLPVSPLRTWPTASTRWTRGCDFDEGIGLAQIEDTKTTRRRYAGRVP